MKYDLFFTSSGLPFLYERYLQVFYNMYNDPPIPLG